MLRQRLHGSEVRGVLFGVDIGNDGVGLAQCDLGAELEDSRGKLVFGRERGCVEFENGGVLALVEGVVDVDEFWLLLVMVSCATGYGNGWLREGLPPSAENGSILIELKNQGLV